MRLLGSTQVARRSSDYCAAVAAHGAFNFSSFSADRNAPIRLDIGVGVVCVRNVLKGLAVLEG